MYRRPQNADAQPLAGTLWTVADVILAETAGQVYRLIHGLERCCGLDSASCVLTGLVVYDRLCRRLDQGMVDQRLDHGEPVSDPACAQKTTQENGEQRRTASQSMKPSTAESRVC